MGWFNKKEQLLNFFIAQQSRLTEFTESTLLSLAEIRKKCEQNFTVNCLRPYLSDKVTEGVFANRIPDQDFIQLFCSAKQLEQKEISRSSHIYSLFTSPISSLWQNILRKKLPNDFVLRSGFYQTEYEIYNSIYLNFDGMFVYTTGLDKYKIQYFTEIGRDFRFSLVFIVGNQKELEEVLNTDAPYLAISSYDATDFSQKSALLYQLAPAVPKSALLLGWCKTAENFELLKKTGYTAIFASVPYYKIETDSSRTGETGTSS